MIIARKATQNWDKIDFHQLNEVVEKNGDENSKFQIDNTPNISQNLNFKDIEEKDFDQKNINTIDYNQFKLSMFNFAKTYENDETLIINFASEAIILLNSEETKKYNQLKHENKSTNNNFLQELINLGICVKKEKDEVFPFLAIRCQSAFTESHIKNITILPTQNCNAKCFYCFAEKQKRITMTPEIVEDSINFITNFVKKGDTVGLKWFGGEPLLAEKWIDRIIEGITEYFENDIEYFSNITTNGSLITDTLIDKMIKNWHIRRIHLTLDGTREEHNKRKNYNDKNFDGYQKTLENIQKLLAKGVFVCCRLNLDKKNFEQFYELLDVLQPYAKNPLFFVHATTLHRPEFGKEADYFTTKDLKDFATKIYTEMLDRGFYQDVLDILPRRAFNRCVACMNDSIVIGADGYLYKCTQKDNVPEESVGTCKDGILINENFSKWMDPNLWKESCNKCAFLPICQGGCKYYRTFENEDISSCTRAVYYMPFFQDKIYEEIKKRTNKI